MYNPTEIDSEILPKLTGFYRGIVVNNNDELKSGRIQINVIPFFDGVKQEDLPWAIYADSFMGGLSNNGGIMIPEVGSHVFVFFENGDHRYPVYFAGAPAIQKDIPDIPTLSYKDDGTVQTINNNTVKNVQKADGGFWSEPDSAYASEYPNNKVIRTKSGIVFEYDDTPQHERIHIFHPSGTRTEIDTIGNKVEHVVGAKYKVVIGDENISVSGDVNITVSGTVNLKAQTVNVDCNDINFDNNGNPAGVVTVNHVCAFTGNPHPQGSSTTKAGG